MDKLGYLNILKQKLKNSEEKINLGWDYYFGQNNDSKHMAYIVRQWIIFTTPQVIDSFTCYIKTRTESTFKELQKISLEATENH